MEILLLDNAIDSLEWALRHLTSFLKKDVQFNNPEKSTTYLKQTILCLNSALELFFKAKISDINPILIYDNLCTKDMNKEILEYYCKRQLEEINAPLYDYIVEKTEIHTIEYSKCIDLFCMLYSVGEGDKKNFIEINQIRNNIMHLGVKSREEYYKLAGQLAEILFFLQYNLLRTINFKKRKLKKMCSDMCVLEHTLSSLEDNIWVRINIKKVEYVCKELERAFNDVKVQRYLSDKGISAEFGLTLDAEFMYSVIYMNYEDIEVNIAAVYSSGAKDALIICDEWSKDGPIYAVIELNVIDIGDNERNKFYLSYDKKGTIIENYEQQGEFWKEGKYRSKFAKVPFGKTKKIELMMKIIDSIEDIEFDNRI